MNTSLQGTTIQALAARRTGRGCENLIASASAMPDEKKNWSPMASGQSVNALLLECTRVNLKWAATLQNRVYTRVSPEAEETLHAALEAGRRITDLLHHSAGELVAAIQSVRDEELAEMIKAPFGIYSLADCCLIAYWNMVYHEGQINYIQTLYGDQTRHTAF